MIVDIGIAGGKGAQLGEMYNNNFPVPAAFVVTAQAYKEFLQVTQLDGKIKQVPTQEDYAILKYAHGRNVQE